MKRFLKNHKGVTMMEVLVTVALLAIVVVPCLSSFIMAQKGNALAAKTQNEYTQAQNLMEELKAYETIAEIETRLLNDYSVDGVEVNMQDDIHVVYIEKTEYIEIYIYVGEDSNRNITADGSLCESCDLLLKGVIAP